jgi:glutamate-1-semialdehyde 2,1-aminomutase
MGRQLCSAALTAARTKGMPLQAPQCGSMFSLFFTAIPVRDYPTALTSDAKLFGRFFHACLDAGIYVPPSAYESWFLSTAHEGPAIEQACEVIAKAISSL